jgi:catecholate siderophore receptor
MEEALRYVPGITFSAGEGGQMGDSPFIRGFVARGDMFRDGVRDPGWYTRDMFSSDRVEVYKGPSAFAFGRGVSGGAINFVSKLPTGQTYLDTLLTVSTPQGVRTEVDASGKIGNISARIAAMGQNIDTPDRDHVSTKRWGFAPSFAVDLTDQTKVTLSHIYQGEQSVPDYGHPWLPAPTYSASTGALTNGGYYGNGSPVTPVPVPRSNWYGVINGLFPDLVFTTTNISTAKIEHEFSDTLKISNTTRYVSVEREAQPTAPRNLGLVNQLGTTATTPPANYPVNLMTIGRQHFRTDTDNTLIVNQTDLLAKFNTGFLRHTLAAGIEFARETRWQARANLCNPTGAGACRTSLWSPDPDPVNTGTFTGFGAPSETVQRNIGAYISDQIKIGRYFEVMGSVRLDRFETDFTSGAPPVGLTKTDNLTSYRVGVVFHPWEHASIYVAHGNSYNPSAEFGTLSSAPNNAASILLDPEENVSYEAGVKVDVLNQQLSLTGAVFRIEKTNLRIPNDPVLNTFTVLDGLARVDGIELGVVGKITQQWNISVGYSYLDSEIVKTTNLNELGRQLPNTPPHNFTLWSTYMVTPEWTIGGGAIYQSSAFANTGNTQYVPDYWRFDAMTSYRITPSALLQLNVYNITDEFYYAQYYGGHAVPAPGRSASLSLRVRW